MPSRSLVAPPPAADDTFLASAATAMAEYPTARAGYRGLTATLSSADRAPLVYHRSDIGRDKVQESRAYPVPAAWLLAGQPP